MNVNEWTGFNYSEELVEQAANWLGFLDGNLSADELGASTESFDILEKGVKHLPHDKRLEFFAWLSEDPQHQHVFADCCELWAKSSCLESFKSSINTSNILDFPKQNEPPLSIQSVFNDPPSSSQAAPVWAYNLVLGLIIFGMSLPFFG